MTMKVELIDSAGGDLSIVNSARVSFAKEAKEITGNDERLINYLARHRHDTPFRHNFIQLRCSVPLFLARQLMKHQAGLTWNEVSRRYVDDTPEFYMPEEWRSRPEGGIKQGSGKVLSIDKLDFYSLEHINNYWHNTTAYDEGEEYTESCYPEYSLQDAFDCLIDEAVTLYEKMLKAGVAPEMARMVLPQSMMVDFIWSGNLLAFYHVYNLRSGEGAQVEAREFAELLKAAVEPEFSIGWAALERRDER